MAEVDDIPAPIKEIIDRTLPMVHALTGAVEAIQTVADKNKLLETMAMMKRSVEDERRTYEEASATLPRRAQRTTELCAEGDDPADQDP